MFPVSLNPWLLIGCLAFFPAVRAADFKIRVDRENGVYASGESATWTIETVNLASEETAPASVNYKLVSNSLDTLQAGEIRLAAGRGRFSASREAPGTLMLVLESAGFPRPVTSGAVFDPQALKPSLPRPDDFEAFWAGKVKEAEAVPLNPVLTPEVSSNDDVELWQITLDNVRGVKVRGQLARPKGHEAKKLPAMLIVQWAGFYPLARQWAVRPASEGWLVLNTQAHDIPVYEPREVYQTIQNGTHKDFYKIGNEDRETSYYLGMYLGTVQAVRYLKSRPDWDGTVLVVRGGSQGGMLALVAAGLNAGSVTGTMAKVPGGCDLNGQVAGNRSGLPDWWNSALERSNPQKVRRAAEYYDVVNFASMIKSPTLIGIALGDLTCPPPGMFIVNNQLKAPQELFIMPSASHGTNRINPHRPYDNKEAEWLEALKQNNVPPTAKLR